VQPLPLRLLSKLKESGCTVEGCWHLYTTAAERAASGAGAAYKPGILLGTGFEDFFNSGWGFSVAPFWMRDLDVDDNARPWDEHSCNATAGVCRRNGLYFQTPASGLLHWSSDRTTDRLSAYRFFDQEVVGFSDGGSLEWRVGDEAPKGTKNGTTGEFPIGTCQSAADLAKGCTGATVHSYAWVYRWALGGEGG